MIYILSVIFICKSVCVVGMLDDSVYFGRWHVDKIIPLATPTIVSKEEAEKIIGTEISYERKKVAAGKSECNNPIYKEIWMNRAEFYNVNRVVATELGLVSEQIEIVLVQDSGGNIWNSPGAVFIVKDQNTLIVNYNGTYFEMKRFGGSGEVPCKIYQLERDRHH